jgi:uncharacterized membrane protein
MEKQQIVSFIEGQIASGRISRSELIDIANGEVARSHSDLASEKRESSSKNLIGTFYTIGAIIVILGVGILAAQHWDEIGFIGRILITLGISLVTYMSGLLLNKPHQKIVSQVFFTLSASLAPLGAYVLLKEANIIFDSTTQVATALVLLTLFGTALAISKKNVLVLISIGFATWAYYACIVKVFGFTYYNFDLFKWATMLLGLSYILVAYGYKATETEQKAVKNLLYGFGTLAILGAGISIGGTFDLFFIALIFAAFYGSVYLRSGSMLILGALFLMAHIIKLTSKYFVGSIGWPVALILVGFFVIGVGYMTYYLNKKFISTK